MCMIKCDEFKNKKWKDELNSEIELKKEQEKNNRTIAI